MAVTRIFTPENRLAKILLSVEAPTAGELIADAEERVRRMEDSIRAYVMEKQAEIMAYADQGDDVLFAECRTLGDAALNVAEVAGAAGLVAIGEIARGISAMVDGLLSSGVWHTDALRLHINALSLVDQRSGASATESDLVLVRLRTMREAVGIVE